MTSTSIHPDLQQISLSATNNAKQPVSINDATHDNIHQDRVSFNQTANSIAQGNVCARLTDTCPHPMLVGHDFMTRVQEFNHALIKAIVHIVDNWWEGDYPCRMPLEPHEEAVLKWVHQQSTNGSIRPFRDCMGHFRPDFVLTGTEHTVPFRVCEINCRTPFNAILSSAYRYSTISTLLQPHSAIQPASEFDTLVDDLFSLFEPSQPIHLITGRDEMSREDFVSLAHKRTGLCPRMVNISDLRLKPDTASKTGRALYHVYHDSGKDEKSERIHQAVPLLFADEFRTLSHDLLCHLALVSVNDLRSILIVHDKRLLAIVRQEVEPLATSGVLTPEQGTLLTEAIVPTILPASQDLENFLTAYHTGAISKADFILKPWHLSRGSGHLLGETLSTEEWEQNLVKMRDTSDFTQNTQYLLQPYIKQPVFGLLLDGTTLTESYVVGTYHAVNGRFVGLGTWRTGQGRICTGFSGGNVPLISVTAVEIA